MVARHMVSRRTLSTLLREAGVTLPPRRASEPCPRCTNIIVLGSGYSGTSSVAHELHGLGWAFGERKHMIMDFGEDRRLIGVNQPYINETGLLWQRMVNPLHSNGSSNRSRSPMDTLAMRFGKPGRRLVSDNPEATRLLQSYALPALLHKRPFVLKDPRLIFTLHLWHSLLARLQDSHLCTGRTRHAKRLRRKLCSHRMRSSTGPVDRLPLVLSVARNLTAMRRSYLARANVTSAAAATRPQQAFEGLTVDEHIALKEAWRHWQLEMWPGPKLEVDLAAVQMGRRWNVMSRPVGCERQFSMAVARRYICTH